MAPIADTPTEDPPDTRNPEEVPAADNTDATVAPKADVSFGTTIIRVTARSLWSNFSMPFVVPNVILG